MRRIVKQAVPPLANARAVPCRVRSRAAGNAPRAAPPPAWASPMPAARALARNPFTQAKKASRWAASATSDAAGDTGALVIRTEGIGRRAGPALASQSSARRSSHAATQRRGRPRQPAQAMKGETVDAWSRFSLCGSARAESPATGCGVCNQGGLRWLGQASSLRFRASAQMRQACIHRNVRSSTSSITSASVQPLRLRTWRE